MAEPDEPVLSRRMAVAALCVTLGLLVLGIQTVNADPLARLDGLKADRQAIVDAFAMQIEMCVERRDTDHVVFHGCIDWHSATHGFWALTAAARLAGRGDLGDLVLERLDEDGMAREQALLNRRPGFEMPYGRAWFLRLAIEFERAFDNRRLRTMASDTATSIRSWLERRRIDPDSLSYESTSWALLNLRAWGQHVGDGETVAFVDDIVHTTFVPFDTACRLDRDETQRSFMAGCTNRAWLVSEVLTGAAFTDWLNRYLPDPTALSAITTPANAHVYGLDFSRAWGLWRLYRATGDTRYLDMYLDHFSIAYEKAEWWRGGYRTVGHWVAQFGMFAAMPLFEEDYW